MSEWLVDEEWAVHDRPRKLHFILDCDDVLLDWMAGFKMWLGANHGLNPIGTPDSWCMASWLGLSKEKAFSHIQAFNASPDFGNLPACIDAVHAVRTLRSCGHELSVVTSCSSDAVTVERRRGNLHRIFGPIFREIVCLDLGESKEGRLRTMRQGIWVEDNYRNALAGFRAGHKTFMMRRRHNRSDEPGSNPHIVWVDDWRPIISLFS